MKQQADLSEAILNGIDLPNQITTKETLLNAERIAKELLDRDEDLNII